VGVSKKMTRSSTPHMYKIYLKFIMIYYDLYLYYDFKLVQTFAIISKFAKKYNKNDEQVGEWGLVKKCYPLVNLYYTSKVYLNLFQNVLPFI